jgi:hypothetical protein
MPIMAYTEKHFGKNSNAFGFGADRGMGWPLDPYPGHGLRDVIVNSQLNFSALNPELFGWSAGSLLLVALGLFAGRLRGNDLLMLVAIAAVFVAHAFYWFSGGPDFGARYWHLMFAPLLILAARGIEFLEARISPGHAAAVIAALCGLTLATYLPWRAIDKYHRYLRMAPDVRELAEKHRFGRSLVLVRGEEFPDYGSAAVYNPLDWNGTGPVYAHDKSPEVRAALLKAYAGRPVWILDGPSLSPDGRFRVAAGPTPAHELANH